MPRLNIEEKVKGCIHLSGQAALEIVNYFTGYKHLGFWYKLMEASKSKDVKIVKGSATPHNLASGYNLLVTLAETSAYFIADQSQANEFAGLCETRIRPVGTIYTNVVLAAGSHFLKKHMQSRKQGERNGI